MTWLALEKVFLWFLLYSFVGWLWETVLNIVMKKRFVDRGILNGPVCPIYGVGMAAGSVALSSVKDSYVILFVFGVVFCSVVEYIVGGILERLFHSKWWDYSHMRYNIKGRVCLRNAVLFGFGAIVVFRFAQPMVEDVISRVPIEMKVTIAAVFSIAFFIDLAVSARRAWTYRSSQEGDGLRLLFKAHR